jgi:glutamate-1-semialdehyde 2,1-aminomutase
VTEAARQNLRYAASSQWRARAAKVIPGAHHLSGRPLLPGEDAPAYMTRGQGARCWDADGHEYIDYIGAYGPFLLGYAHPVVDSAARAQLERGSLLSLNHPLHVEFAERLVARFESAEMVTFFKTGSEATTAALRVARAATGRKTVVRCGYHGWHDWCLPLEPFVPGGLAAQVLELDASKPESLERLLSEAPAPAAAVIVAPEMFLPTRREIFHQLLATTRAHGAVFILDEVKTALRIKPGSFQEHVGIRPDLTTLSKALGNGWPIAALVGKREVMQAAAGLHLSATYHGETAGMAAAMATLDFVESHPVAEHVWSLGERLIAGLNESASRHGIPALAFGEPLPPMPFLKFSVADEALNQRVKTRFYSEVLARGVLLHPRHLWFISYAHTASDIERTLEVADTAFRLTRAELAA